MESGVELRGVTRRHGRGAATVVALDGVTSTSPRGTFTAVMGRPAPASPRCCTARPASTARPRARSCIGGIDLAGSTRPQLTVLRRDRIGFVFQAFNLLPALTAEQNVALPLRLAGRRPTGPGRRRRSPRRARRPRRAPAGRAVRRPAAAGRDRPGAGHPARRAVRRRADRRAGHRDAPARCSRCCARCRSRRADDRHGHPRPGRRGLRRPRAVPRRRPDRGRARRRRPPRPSPRP